MRALLLILLGLAALAPAAQGLTGGVVVCPEPLGACGGYFQNDHPGCPGTPSQGADVIGAFGSAGGVAYYHSCATTQSGETTNENGVQAFVMDPSSATPLVWVAWFEDAGPGGHSCTAFVHVGPVDEPLACPLDLAPPFVLP